MTFIATSLFSSLSNLYITKQLLLNKMISQPYLSILQICSWPARREQLCAWRRGKLASALPILVLRVLEMHAIDNCASYYQIAKKWRENRSCWDISFIVRVKDQLSHIWKLISRCNASTWRMLFSIKIASSGNYDRVESRIVQNHQNDKLQVVHCEPYMLRITSRENKQTNNLCFHTA